MNSLKHILIVEDDYLLALDIMQNLTKNGFIISGMARNLQEAVKIMNSKTVDLALIDMLLDGPEDGVITATELLKIKWVPIIYITGNTPLQVKDRLKETFPAAFLEKPLRFGELAVQIELALNNFDAGSYPGFNKTNPDNIYLPSSSGLIKVKVSEIIYIRAEKRKSHIFLTKGEALLNFPARQSPSITVSLNKGTIYPQLPSYFFELSRSIVINLNQIQKIDGNTIHLQSHILVIPDARKQLLIDQLTIVKK
jgi:DNA-binding LytR/AlgR family response regulator